MQADDIIYRCLSRMRHLMTARNTLGYGVHSPHLYYIIRFLIYDDNRYYCFAPIENERQRLLRAKKEIGIEDFGTGISGKRRIKDIARKALMPAKEAQMLFRIVNYMKPLTVIELGTSLGITTAYLSKAAGRESKVVTFEGSKTLTDEAKKVWKNTGAEGIETVGGNIDKTLGIRMKSIDTMDFALIDANHTYEATVRYFRQLASKCGKKSIIAVDDIHNSREMSRAWEAIKTEEAVTATLDMYDTGLVFFDKCLMKKNYVLRVDN